MGPRIQRHLRWHAEFSEIAGDEEAGSLRFPGGGVEVGWGTGLEAWLRWMVFCDGTWARACDTHLPKGIMTFDLLVR